MFSMTAKEISDAIDGILIGNPQIKANKVSTDTRKIEKENLFIALSGENFDANMFVDKAFENGASVCIASADNLCPEGKALILVQDTKRALMELASFYRDKFNIKLIGITGSVGKTTTKEMTACVLSQKYKTHKTMGNFNNNIGMPLTLLSMESDTRAAVIEMGMNARGEISALTRVAKPTAAIITNIGISHIEHLKTRENILLAKAEILEGMNKDSYICINADDEYLPKINADGKRVITYGIDNECDVRGKMISDSVMEVFGVKINMPVEGKHNMYNALSAIAVGINSGLTVEECAKGIEEYKTDGIRQSVLKSNGKTFICDYYNASPVSVIAALKLLKSGNAKRYIAVLGDMGELGDYAEKSHIEVLQEAKNLNVDYIFTVGKEMKKAAQKVQNIKSFDTNEEISEFLNTFLKKEDRILIKGSHFMNMGEIYGKVR